MKKIIIYVICISALLALSGCGNKQDCKLLENASPETSAMSFYYFDGEKTIVKWLYDQEKEKKIIDEINKLHTQSVDFAIANSTIDSCYGLEIVDKEGYEIWLTYIDGIWLLKNGATYKAEYDFKALYESIPETDTDSWDSGIGMPNSAILGQNDVRFYAKAQDLSNEKNGIVLSITSIEDGIVTVKVQNNTDNDFEYGEYYSLQKEVDGQWYTLPVKLSNFGFTDIGIILGAGESREEKCDISIYGGLQAGHYKLEKEGMATDFFVESDNSMHANVDSECECAELEIPALIKVNGLLYYDSAETSTELRCGMMDGTIDSVCEGDIPAQDNQSNFGSGYSYQYGVDTIEVSIDDEWHIFKKFDYDEWNILPEYVYYGDDPIENVITNYVLANNYHYEMKASVAIPAFCIFMSEVDENDADMIKVYGNYWLFTYDRIDNTLECMSGGEAPGVMYVKKNGSEYAVDHFEQVRDGSFYTEDIKAICNGNKSLEEQFYDSSDAMTTKRIYNIQKYVEMFNLDIDSYHDYGWDKVMLSDFDFNSGARKEETTAITDYKAAIMVDGKIYLLSLQPMSGEVDNSAIIGYTSSYTDTFPEKDGETNFNREIGMPYAKVEEGIAVLYEDEWYLCTPK